jgi:hypothetical protein
MAARFTDGDIPRQTYDKYLFGLGYAYYSCSVKGQCSQCHHETTMWHVTIKADGKYLCQACHEAIKDHK